MSLLGLQLQIMSRIAVSDEENALSGLDALLKKHQEIQNVLQKREAIRIKMQEIQGVTTLPNDPLNPLDTLDGIVKDDNFQWNNSTLLGYAAFKGCQKVIEKLIACGARLDAIDGTGKTALECAIQNKQLHAARILLEKFREQKISVDMKQMLQAAIQADAGEFVPLLKEFGADLNVRYVHDTPLILAAADKKPHMVKALRLHGADPDLTDKAGRDALVWSIMTYGGADHKTEKMLEVLQSLCNPGEQKQSHPLKPIKFDRVICRVRTERLVLYKRNILFVAVESNSPQIVNFLLKQEGVIDQITQMFPEVEGSSKQMCAFTAAVKQLNFEIVVPFLRTAGNKISLNVLRDGFHELLRIDKDVVTLIAKILTAEIARRTKKHTVSDLIHIIFGYYTDQITSKVRAGIIECCTELATKQKIISREKAYLEGTSIPSVESTIEKHHQLFGPQSEQKKEVKDAPEINGTELAPSSFKFAPLKKTVREISVTETKVTGSFIKKTIMQNKSITGDKARDIVKELLESPDALLEFQQDEGRLLTRALAIVVCYEIRPENKIDDNVLSFEKAAPLTAQLWKVIKAHGLAYHTLCYPCDDYGNTILHVIARGSNDQIGKLFLQEFVPVAPFTLLRLTNKDGAMPAETAEHAKNGLQACLKLTQKKKSATLIEFFYCYVKFSRKPLEEIHRIPSSRKKRIAQRYLAANGLLKALVTDSVTPTKREFGSVSLVDQMRAFVEITGGADGTHEFANHLNGLLLSPQLDDSEQTQILFDSDDVILARLKQQAKELLEYLVQIDPLTHNVLIKEWNFPPKIEKPVHKPVEFCDPGREVKEDQLKTPRVRIAAHKREIKQIPQQVSVKEQKATVVSAPKLSFVSDLITAIDTFHQDEAVLLVNTAIARHEQLEQYLSEYQRLNTELKSLGAATVLEECKFVEEDTVDGIISIKWGYATSPIIYAAIKGKEKLVERLLELNADPCLWIGDVRSALFEAIMRHYNSSHRGLFKLLLAAAKNQHRENLGKILDAHQYLHIAGALGEVDIVTQLLDAGASINRPVTTMLSVCVSTDRSVELNKDHAGQTALMLAMAKGHKDVEKVLRQRGADLTVVAESKSAANVNSNLNINGAAKLQDKDREEQLKQALEMGVAQSVKTWDKAEEAKKYKLNVVLNVVDSKEENADLQKLKLLLNQFSPENRVERETAQSIVSLLSKNPDFIKKLYYENNNYLARILALVVHYENNQTASIQNPPTDPLKICAPLTNNLRDLFKKHAKGLYLTAFIHPCDGKDNHVLHIVAKGTNSWVVATMLKAFAEDAPQIAFEIKNKNNQLPHEITSHTSIQFKLADPESRKNATLIDLWLYYQAFYQDFCLGKVKTLTPGGQYKRLIQRYWAVEIILSTILKAVSANPENALQRDKLLQLSIYNKEGKEIHAHLLEYIQAFREITSAGFGSHNFSDLLAGLLIPIHVPKQSAQTLSEHDQVCKQLIEQGTELKVYLVETGQYDQLIEKWKLPLISTADKESKQQASSIVPPAQTGVEKASLPGGAVTASPVPSFSASLSQQQTGQPLVPSPNDSQLPQQTHFFPAPK